MSARDLPAAVSPAPTLAHLYTRQIALLMRIHASASAGLDEAIRYGLPHEAVLAMVLWADEGIAQVRDVVAAQLKERAAG